MLLGCVGDVLNGCYLSLVSVKYMFINLIILRIFCIFVVCKYVVYEIVKWFVFRCVAVGVL